MVKHPIGSKAARVFSNTALCGEMHVALAPVGRKHTAAMLGSEDLGQNPGTKYRPLANSSNTCSTTVNNHEGVVPPPSPSPPSQKLFLLKQFLLKAK